jgi:hypothetical protein
MRKRTDMINLNKSNIPTMMGSENRFMSSAMDLSDFDIQAPDDKEFDISTSKDVMNVNDSQLSRFHQAKGKIEMVQGNSRNTHANLSYMTKKNPKKSKYNSSRLHSAHTTNILEKYYTTVRRLKKKQKGSSSKSKS